MPVFAFRANDCYSPIPGLERLNRYLSKKVRPTILYVLLDTNLKNQYRVVLPLVRGILGTPWPRSVPVDIVVGEPIHVEKKENYTNEDVDQMHQRYTEALEKLYNQHKATYGSADRPLIIIDAE